MKLPLFNDEKDDLDAYLIRFERACAAFEIRPEFWSTQLARLLQGRSLDVYQRLPAEEVDNNESLKTQLLKRFRLTEGGHRKKFKMSKLEVGETPEQFVERLNRYIVKWCEMAGYANDYDGLKSLIIREAAISSHVQRKYQWNKNHYNERHRVHNVCSQEVTSQAGTDDWII